MNALAASGFLLDFRIATGSVTADTPSAGNTNSTGAPFAFSRMAMKSTRKP